MPDSDESSLSGVLEPWRRLIAALSDPAVLLDTQLAVLGYNQAYARTIGLRPARIEHLRRESHITCREMLRLDICDQCIGKKALESGRGVRFDEVKARSPFGDDVQEMLFVVTAIPVQDVRGTAIGIVEIYRDVSAEAKLQERFKSLLETERKRAETLEQMVAERTKDLQQSLEALKQTQAQLVQAEKLSSLGRLVAGIAHEISNPLNFIYANTDFLDVHVATLTRAFRGNASAAGEKLDDTLTDLSAIASSIRQGAERAFAIIRDLRMFTPRGPVEMEPVDLRQCLQGALNILHHEIQRVGANVAVHADGPDPIIAGNSTQIQQLVMNLVTNALHALPQRGHVDLYVDPGPDGIVLRVVDDGRGMDENTLSRIFDPFFTTKAVGQGTGLGLSICRRIVENHGAKIEVSSTVGKGTTFRITFPLKAQ